MPSLLQELKRRNVVRVGIFYAVLSWLILQVADVIFGVAQLPEWSLTLVAIILALGFVPALIFAWVFELTPEGIKRESEIDRSRTITHHTARKLDLAVIGLLVVAIAVFGLDRFLTARPEPATPTPAAAASPADPAPAAEQAATDRSIAVLPFSNLSTNPETDSFVAGLHDDLLTQLSKIGDLRVIARTSVLQYQNTTRRISEIGRELGVAHVLEGGVQRAGDRMRLNVQLIDSGSDEHLWAETYDRRLSVDNIFDIQSEITREIVDQLRGALSEGESAVLAERPTESLAAYEAFMDARLLIQRSGTGDFDFYDQAIDAARRAIELDPDFADAWGVLASALLNEFWYKGRDPAMAEAAKQAIDRGLALDPDSAETRIAAGWYPYWVFFDYAAAIPQFERALELWPGARSAWDGLASVYRRSGRFDEAVAAFQTAVEVDPNVQIGYLEIGETHLALRRYDEAMAALMRGKTRFPRSHDFAVGIARIHAWRTGEHHPLVQAMRQRADIDNLSVQSRFEYVLLEGIHGDTDAALANLAEWSPGIIDVQYQYWTEDLLAGYLHFHSGNRLLAAELATAELPRIEAALATEPNNAELEKARAFALAIAGQADEAVASATRLRQLYPMSLDAFGGSEYFDSAISIVAMAGNVDLALDWLQEYLSEPCHRSPIAIANDPAFANIVSTARFQALVENAQRAYRG